MSGWTRTPRPEARPWLPVLALSALLALGWEATRVRPSADALRSARLGGDEATLSVRQLLAARDGLFVDQTAWEQKPPEGLAGAVLSARLLALASDRPGGPRDLYRVEVRLTPAGVPLEVSRPWNLTRTKVGDERGLAIRPPLAAFQTFAFGQLQAITVLDLRGIADAERVALGVTGRGQRALTELLSTGDPRGLGRTIVRVQQPIREAQIEWGGPGLLKVLGPGLCAFVDLRRGVVRGSSELTVERPVLSQDDLALWAVETVRSVVGPGPIAWLEARVFAIFDIGRRFVHGSSRMAPHRARQPVRSSQSSPSVWPPAPVSSLLSPPEPFEGVWRPSAPSFTRRLAGAPPAFYETFVRADPDRSFVRVHIVAMDLRQLELGIVAGAEDPEPAVGPPGTGKLPRRPEVLSNIVATFNGAFKAKHGAYGMIEDGRVILPPVRDAATVAVHADGRIGIGSWQGGRQATPGIISLRQNLDALVDRGVLNPRRRRIWGFPFPGMEEMETARSGMCVSRSGALLYFYAPELSAQTLGRAMQLAGCSYGLHLDMNPHHCAFVYARIDDIEQNLYRAQLMRKGMMDPRRTLVRSAKDFFYVALRRSPLPPAPEAGWTSEGLPQPEPTFLPSSYRGRLGDVELWSIAPGRVRLAVQSADDAGVGGVARPCGSLGAVAIPGSGLFAHGKVFRPLRPGAPTLAIREDGSLAMGPWPIPQAVLAVQGEPLLDSSRATAAALGLGEDGRLTIALGPAPLLEGALQRVGATGILLLAPGRRVPLVEMGTVRGDAEQDRLLLLATPPRAIAFRIDLANGAL